MNPRFYYFSAGELGSWRIREIRKVIGESLELASRLDVAQTLTQTGQQWVLSGVRSNERYTTRSENGELKARQEGLGRPASTCAVLIPIKKSQAWWDLSQDERREIFEEQSRHTTIGLKYLPDIARRLFHCRDLANAEPFDFLTWFEFAPERETYFDDLVASLRASLEWKYVEREVDVRLER